MRINNQHGGMIHWNGNIVCAVDVETTGVIPGHNEIFQVAVLPLDSDFKPLKTIFPFYMNIRPEFPERIDDRALKVTKKELSDLMAIGIDKWKAADLFDEWFTAMDLPITNASHKKIMPLWSNGDFDKSFLLEWLGPEHYNQYFHFHSRDTQASALEINDRFYQHGEKIPFPKVGVEYLASCFDINQENAHNALDDCITTAEIYSRMTKMWIPTNPKSHRVDGPVVDYSRK